MNPLAVALPWLIALPLVLSYATIADFGNILDPDTNSTFSSIHISDSSHKFQPRDYNVLGTGFRSVWPITYDGAAGKLRVIHYCYADAEARASLECNLQKAISVWGVALNGPASDHSRHNLSFLEKKGPDGLPAFCYAQWDRNTMSGTWSKDMPSDTLSIMLAPSGSTLMWGTLGYEATPDKSARHNMMLVEKANPSEDDIGDIVHEVR
jgi:hypothetical protein